MRKNFILDTNVLLHDPHSLYHFADNTVILPIEVIEELDSFKKDASDLGHNSRMVAQNLDQLRRQGNLGEGVRLPGGGLLQVYAGERQDVLSRFGLRPRSGADYAILNLAVFLTDREAEQPAIIVTKSINLRLKADALGIYAEDYEEAIGEEALRDLGWHEVTVADDVLAEARAMEFHSFADRQFRPQEYVLLRGANGGGAGFMGKVSARDRSLVQALKPVSEDGVLGIKPLNVAQCFALDALLDPNVHLLTLMGRAGTGKTLLAVAAGLWSVLKEDAYSHLLVSRMTMPMGRDIGYLPGDVEEKMRPWMQPIHDAIDLIRDVDRRSGLRQIPREILETGLVAIEPLTYIRGRSIANQYVIIDEAQNLTPLEVKTIITRVGRGTKIVLTGDPEQIDNPYVDARSNGFAFVINRFREQALAAHITLTKGERSPLAEAAATLL